MKNTKLFFTVLIASSGLLLITLATMMKKNHKNPGEPSASNMVGGNNIIAKGARLEKLADGFAFTGTPRQTTMAMFSSPTSQTTKS